MRGSGNVKLKHWLWLVTGDQIKGHPELLMRVLILTVAIVVAVILKASCIRWWGC